MTKLTVELNDELTRMVEELASEQGIPKTQVIRRSVALLKFLQDEQSQGRKLATLGPEALEEASKAPNSVVREIIPA